MKNGYIVYIEFLMGITMSKRLMLLLGAVCILLIVVGYINLNWGQDVTATTPNNSTTGDNPEATEDNTSTNSTTNGNTEPSATNNSTDTTEENPSTNSTTNGDTEPPAENNTSTNSTTGDNTNIPTNPINEPDNPSDGTNGDSSNTTKPETPQPNQEDHEDDEDYTWDSEVTTITLNTDSISVDKENGARITGTTITITSAGTYSISGTLEDGQIVVDTNDAETVKLILNGVNISSTTNAPIYVEDAEKTVIILADNTENYLTDSQSNENNGTLASRDDLTIYGNGSLTVYGNANDAIRSNDGLIIKSGNIKVTSVDDGIRGKNYLVIKGGNITVNSVGDGLKSDNDEEEDRGYISIEGGTIKVTSTKGDAVSAHTDLLVTGGTFTLTNGGGSNAQRDENVSTKGLKAGVFIIIDDGNFTVNSSDDAIHSNHMIIINNGVYHLASGDDGIHADTSLEINDGTVDISQSYEGIESETITINNGYIDVTASDDGFNAVGTDDGSTAGGGGWGGGFDETGEFYIYINGGVIVIDSGGDGLDSGGYIEMSDGFVIVNGPVPGSFPNGAIDYGSGKFKLTGGTIVAVGSADMPQAPTPELSTQYSVLVNFRSAQTANKLVSIQTASGETVLTFRPTKPYQSILFSSPELAKGSYNVYLGGTSTGTSSYGVYEDGTYTPGTLYTSFDISEIVTTVGGGGMFWGP
jgi:hypothetical protein